MSEIKLDPGIKAAARSLGMTLAERSDDWLFARLSNIQEALEEQGLTGNDLRAAFEVLVASAIGDGVAKSVGQMAEAMMASLVEREEEL